MIGGGLALVVVVLALACREEVESSLRFSNGVARFVETAPVEWIDQSELFSTRRQAVWSLDGEREPWQLEGLSGSASTASSSHEWVDDGLRVTGGLSLERKVSLAAAEVQTLVLGLTEEDVDLGPARLRWRRSDEEDLPQQRFVRAERARNDGEASEYRFDLGEAVGWRGTIEEVAFELVGPPEPVVLDEISLLEREIVSGALGSHRDRGFLVELDDDLRESLVVGFDDELERGVEIEAGDRISFAYGLASGTRSVVDFTVEVATPGRETVVWRDRLGDAADEWERWSEAEVDLSEYAGRSIRVRSRTTLVEGPDGVAYWGHPEIRRSPTGPRPTNVLLVSLDTVRADHLSLYGYDRPTTPQLEAWAGRRAAVFETVVASAPWTLPSHVSMLTGLDALRHGVNHDVGRSTSQGGSDLPWLAERLRREGYRTAAITGGAYMDPGYGFARGFESYRSWSDRARDRRELTEGVDRSLDFIESNDDEPFFLLLHTYAAHDPYEAYQPFFGRLYPELEGIPGEIALHSPPNQARRGFRQKVVFQHRRGPTQRTLRAEDRTVVEAAYDSGIARVDAELGRLLSGLDALGRFDDTLVVVTSDHGESLLESGRAGHVGLHDEVLLVPLVISWPDGRGAGLRFDRQVRSVDIVPTVLESLGLVPRHPLDGRSLLSLLGAEREVESTEAWSYAASSGRGISLRRDERKVVLNNTVWPTRRTLRRGGWSGECFDLLSDPQELRVLDPLRQLDCSRMLTRLEEHAAETAPGLRLRLANPGPGPFQGEIRGPMVRPLGTKSLSRDCPCLLWEEMGRARFDVPEGKQITIWFEKTFGRRLEIEGEAGGVEVRHEFRTDRLEGVELLTLGADGWVEGRRDTPGAGSLPGAPTIESFWLGEQREDSESPSESDSELREQLEALGYL